MTAIGSMNEGNCSFPFGIGSVMGVNYTTSNSSNFICRCCKKDTTKLCVKGACVQCHKEGLCHGDES